MHRALLLLSLLALPAGPAHAQPVPDDPQPQVAACESLVALRLLAAEAGDDRGRAAAGVARQAGCRLVSRAEVGAVERRAMVGSAPYECLALAAGGCLWVLP